MNRIDLQEGLWLEEHDDGSLMLWMKPYVGEGGVIGALGVKLTPDAIERLRALKEKPMSMKPAFIIETSDGRVIVTRLERGELGPTIVIEIHRSDVRFIEVDLQQAGEIGKAIQDLSSR